MPKPVARSLTELAAEAAMFAFPMHGQHKLISEGYRTRDGHFIEWFGRKLAARGKVAVVSRPEPFVLDLLSKVDYAAVAQNTIPVRATSLRLPNVRDRRRWWIDSLSSYPRDLGADDTPAVVWNPLVALSRSRHSLFSARRPLVFDLLDDWTIHYAFVSIRKDVVRAYEEMFSRADYVTANAEGTLELARRFGRDDCVLLPNGCDPQRFRKESLASGPTTVGYVGKIGKRLNLELILKSAERLPHVNFVFAGPILDAEYKAPLSAWPNVTLLGDVHYDRVPDLLQTFDVGWVPHNVGANEVGGDVIKTYEYRAAGLPVLTTPIAGVTARGLNGVTVLEWRSHLDWLADAAASGPRIARIEGEIPLESTWEFKADRILELASPKAK